MSPLNPWFTALPSKLSPPSKSRNGLTPVDNWPLSPALRNRRATQSPLPDKVSLLMRQAILQSSTAKDFLVDKYEEYQDRYDNGGQIRPECAELVVDLRSPKRRASFGHSYRGMMFKIDNWDDKFDISEGQAAVMEEWQEKFHASDRSSANALPTTTLAFKESIDIQSSGSPIVVKKKRRNPQNMQTSAMQVESAETEIFPPTDLPVRTRSPSNMPCTVLASDLNTSTTAQSGAPKSIPTNEVNEARTKIQKDETTRLSAGFNQGVQVTTNPFIQESQSPSPVMSNPDFHDFLTDLNDAERGYDGTMDDFVTLFDKLGL